MLSALAPRARALALMLTALAACQALAGPPLAAEEVVVLSATPTDGPTKGQLRVEWAESATAGTGYRNGVLRVFELTSPVPVQQLIIEVQAPRELLRFEFLDISGDEAQDLMFFNTEARTDLDADVFLWAPETRRFVQSKILSRRGEIYPDKHKGCVVSFTKCAGPAWSEETLCFNKHAGDWVIQRPARCVEPRP